MPPKTSSLSPRDRGVLIPILKEHDSPPPAWRFPHHRSRLKRPGCHLRHSSAKSIPQSDRRPQWCRWDRAVRCDGAGTSGGRDERTEIALWQRIVRIFDQHGISVTQGAQHRQASFKKSWEQLALRNGAHVSWCTAVCQSRSFSSAAPPAWANQKMHVAP